MVDNWEDDWEAGADNFQAKVSLNDLDDPEDEWESPCNGYISASTSFLSGITFPFQHYLLFYFFEAS